MTFIWMIAVLGVMVFIHELGHFIPAKLFGINVPVFSFGYGKRLFGKKFRGTDYRVSLVPFGGYVKMQGMDPDEYEGRSSDFLSKNVLKRIIVIASGPLGNFIFSFIILLAIVSAYGVSYIENAPVYRAEGSAQGYFEQGDSIISVNGKDIETFTDIYRYLRAGEKNSFTVQRGQEIITSDIMLSAPDSFIIVPRIKAEISAVTPDSPADEAGFMAGDVITGVDGMRINSRQEFADIIKGIYEKPVNVTVSRNDAETELTVIPAKIEYMDNDTVAYAGRIGIEYKLKTVRPGFTGSIKAAWDRLEYISVSIVRFLYMLVTGRMSFKMVGGPISIYSMIGENLKWGFDAFLSFVAFFSLNLFIFNLIPFPPLDGSYIILYLYEAVSRRKVSRKFMLVYQQIGLIILVLLVITVSFNDIMRFFAK